MDKRKYRFEILDLRIRKQESGDRRKSKKLKGKRKKWYENALMLSPVNFEP
jgi:hypothetical protein